MSIVDCHVHLYPPAINAAPAEWARETGEVHWELLCARVRKNGQAVQGFPSVDALLRAMDTAGVERAVLQGWYWEKHDTCRMQNRFYAECSRAHPNRLSACGTFHVEGGKQAIRSEIDWMADAGFVGLGELSPHSQNFAAKDPVWLDALEYCGERELPVLLHVTEPNSKAYPGRVLTPLEDFVEWAKLFPATRLVLAHWGARLPMDPALGEEIRACRNVYFDTAASPLLYDARVFTEMIAAVGAERILFGSDFPLVLFPKTETEPSISSFVAQVKALGLPAKDLVAIFSDSADRVFRK
ncbi:MAG TPA: amidohydrolase family protein [Opitutaceae bacterium]